MLESEPINNRLDSASRLGMRIRVAESDKAAELCALLQRCSGWLELHGNGCWRGAYTPEIVEDYIRNDIVFTCELGGQTIGMVRLSFGEAKYYLEDDFPDKSVPEEMVGYISKLAVDPDYHKNGYGEQLLELAEMIAKEEGCKIIRLDASTLIDALTQFYLKRGYNVVSHRVVPGPGITADNPTNFYEKTL